MNDVSKAVIREINERYDDYVRTVDALLAFAYLMTWDKTAERFRPTTAVFQGARLTHPSGKTITPDLVVLTGKQIDVVAELKISLTLDQERWQKVVRQVEGYCWPLHFAGGKSTSDEKHHVAFLIPYELKNKIASFLRGRAQEKDFSADTPYSALSFVKARKATDHYVFEQFWKVDSLSKPPLPCDDQESVAFDKIKTEYGPAVRLIDQEPPLLFLANIIWDNIFSPKPSEENYIKKRGRVMEFKMTVREILDGLNRLYSFNSILWKYNVDPSRTRGVPQPIRRDWVLRVLNFFIRQKLVEEANSKEHYRVFYKKLRPNTKDFLLKRLANESLVRPKRQLNLEL